MKSTITESTIARMAGNIAASDPRGNMVDQQTKAADAVALARAIVVEIKRTEYTWE